MSDHMARRVWLEPLAPGRLRSILLRASFPPTATNTPILATPNRIPWCQDLRDRFTARFLLVKKHNDQNTPENQEDHPTNGLALCKNHHWAMDRDIIAPGPDLHWHVSKLIDPRRSNGERELAEIAGKSVLLPKDPAFHPVKQGLEWRYKRMTA